MKKRVLLILISLILSLALLTSCGGDEEIPEGDGGEIKDENVSGETGEESGGEEIAELPVSVVFELFGGTNPDGAPTEILPSSAHTLSSVTPSRTNYIFSGWFVDEALSSPLSATSSFVGEVKLYAKWTPKSYTLSFVLNGGKCDLLPESYVYGEGIDLSRVIPTKKNHNFDGWFTNEALTERLPEDPCGDKILYAKFSPESFDIDYELSGGECEGLPRKYVYGVGADLSEFVPTRQGYRFDGWYFDEFYFEEGDLIGKNFADDIDVYAKWIPLPEKISEIPDVVKGYFGIGGNIVEIALSNYIDDHGMDVSYRTSVSDSSLLTASVYNDVLTLEFKKGGSSAEVTVLASFDGDGELSFEFNATSKSYKKIACIGDSLTSGAQNINDAYPTLLQSLLGDEFEVGNFGAGGTSLTNYTNTPDQYSSYVTYKDYHQNSLAFNPDLVIIMFGTNDTKRWAEASLEYKDAYKSLIQSYKNVNPDVDIVICTSPEVLENNSLGIPVGVITEHVYKMQLEVAEEVGAKLVDFHAIIANSSEANKRVLYSDDGVHIARNAAFELAAEIKRII